MKKVGVLAFQGDVSEHLGLLNNLQAEAIPLRSVEALLNVDGLIIPGGESTTVGLLLKQSGLDKAIQKRAKEGMPVWGTCMGAILLAKTLVANRVEQPVLGLIDISVRRNAFGRQKESFEAKIPIPTLKIDDFPAVFIRAPWIETTGNGVEILADFQGKTVLAKERNILVSAFHPEIAKDGRLHQFFLNFVRERGLSN